MQPLRSLTIVDRAKLLFQLFPGEIPAFIVFHKINAEIIIRDQAQLEKTWNSVVGPFHYAFWISLAEDAVTIIEENEIELATQSVRFADQLFDGYNCFFSMEALRKFAKSDKCNNRKFPIAVDLFFSSHNF